MKFQKILVLGILSLHYFNVSAQHIDSIIARSLRALGGMEKFNDLANIKVEGYFFEEGRETEVTEAIAKSDTSIDYFLYKDYFVPFQGRRLEVREQGSAQTQVTIFNVKRGWDFVLVDTGKISIIDVEPMPLYKFLSFYFSSNKYNFNVEYMINNYSTEKNTIYQGIEFKDGIRCIKLLCYGVLTVYLDINTYLPYIIIERFVTKETKNAPVMVTEIKLEDYRLTPYGLQYPYKQTQSIAGSTFVLIHKAQNVEFNQIKEVNTLLNTTKARLAYLKAKKEGGYKVSLETKPINADSTAAQENSNKEIGNKENN